MPKQSARRSCRSRKEWEVDIVLNHRVGLFRKVAQFSARNFNDLGLTFHCRVTSLTTSDGRDLAPKAIHGSSPPTQGLYFISCLVVSNRNLTSIDRNALAKITKYWEMLVRSQGQLRSISDDATSVAVSTQSDQHIDQYVFLKFDNLQPLISSYAHAELLVSRQLPLHLFHSVQSTLFEPRIL